MDKSLFSEHNEDYEDLVREVIDLGTSPECEESTLQASITDVVGRLFKLSRLLTKSTVTDRFVKSELASGDKLDDAFDIGHVKEKCRSGKVDTWLVNRLGSAITKRRQYFRYCRDHSIKIAAPAHRIERSQAQIAAPVQHTLLSPTMAYTHSWLAPSAYSKPSAMHTAASTLGPLDLQIVETGFDDVASEATSIVSFSEGHSGNLLSVPKLAEFAMPGQDFECPYCCKIVHFNGQRGWK